MKRLSLILVGVLFAGICYAGVTQMMQMVVARKSVSGAVWTETFEGANSGCDNVPYSLTADADYTVWEEDGTNSVQVAYNEVAQWNLSSAYDEIFVTFVFRQVNQSGNSGMNAHRVILYTENEVDGLADFSLYKPTSSTYEVQSKASGGTLQDNNLAVSSDTTYYGMLRYKAGTGSDAIAEAWLTTDGDFSGAADQTCTNGADNEGCQNIKLTSSNTAGEAWLVDGVKVYETKPASY